MNSRHTRRWKRSHTIVVIVTIILCILFLNFFALLRHDQETTLGQQQQQQQQQKQHIVTVQNPDVTTKPEVQIPIPKEDVPKVEIEKEPEEKKKKMKKVEEEEEDEEEEEEEKEVPKKNVVPAYSTNTVVNIPIIVVACKRANYLERSLNSLLKYLPSEPIDGVQFSIIVSRDCKSSEVEALLGNADFSTRVSNMRFLPPGEVRTMTDGYSAIARHYKWIFTQTFDVLHYDAAVIVEEDMEIAPDFYEYFAAGYRLLKQDPTLWCVSSWNDNGLNTLVSDPYALYRSDFFPGLGWMLLKSLWKDDLSSKWPSIYWDDYIRRSDIRKGRVCIRPELSRTFNFGEDGVSKGQFFSTHLKHISPNKVDIKWSQMNLVEKYTQKNYDKKFLGDLRKARLVNDWMEIYSAGPVKSGQKPKNEEEVVIPYTNAGFPSIAKKFGLMEDFKDGVARTAYMGVVTFKWGGYKVNLVPKDFLKKIGK